MILWAPSSSGRCEILRFYGFVWFHSNRMFGTGQKLARADTGREVWEKFGMCWFSPLLFFLQTCLFEGEGTKIFTPWFRQSLFSQGW